MYKLAAILLATMLMLGDSAWARLYWLPDYQMQDMKALERSSRPHNNRTSSCTTGGYYEAPLGSGYICSRIIYAHRACYTCSAAPCGDGYSTSTTTCAEKRGYRSDLVSSGVSGGKPCRKCVYTAKNCASGYTAGLSSCTDGYDYSSNGYAGEKICGKCEPKSCELGYTAGITKCSGNGWKYSSQGYAGEEICGKCEPKSCELGYTAGVTECSGKGWKYSSKGYAGEDICGKCEIYIPQPSKISDSASIRKTSLFDGRANTKAMIDQIGDEALAATACNQFYAPGVDRNDANFGQGQWYVPAVGELMEMVGLDASAMTHGTGDSGATCDNVPAIHNALTILEDADALGINKSHNNFYYYSSSELSNGAIWVVRGLSGWRWGGSKDNCSLNYNLQCFQFLENKFNPVDVESAPKIGDVMYSDLTYGSADDDDGSKTAVGIVTYASEDRRSVKIVTLKNLRFGYPSAPGFFEPNKPYAGDSSCTDFTTPAKRYEDITGIDNYYEHLLLPAFQEAVAESQKQAAP